VGAFSELFARLDPDPRLRGKQFEHVCKWFLTNDPTYKKTLRRGFTTLHHDGRRMCRRLHDSDLGWSASTQP
jgi:hypothetical protein